MIHFSGSNPSVRREQHLDDHTIVIIDELPVSPREVELLKAKTKDDYEIAATSAKCPNFFPPPIDRAFYRRTFGDRRR